MRTLLLLGVACCSMSALAEEPSAPPVMSTEQAEVSQVPSGFLDQALKVDVKNEITEGRSATPVTHRQLFERLGRTDLVAESTAREQRRLWLLVSAGAVAVAGVVSGSIFIATGPNLASPACESDVRIYNEVCVPRAAQHNIAGTALIATGVATGLLLATLAYWSDPRVLTRDETSALISSYNSGLAKKLKTTPSGWKITPVITPDGAAVAASVKF